MITPDVRKAVAIAAARAWPVFVREGWKWATSRGYGVPFPEEIEAEFLYQAEYIIQNPNAYGISSGRLLTRSMTGHEGHVEFLLELSDTFDPEA